MDDDTEVYRSCSATLNGELYVFGGSNTSNNRQKQVLISTINIVNLTITSTFEQFRFQKS